MKWRWRRRRLCLVLMVVGWRQSCHRSSALILNHTCTSNAFLFWSIEESVLLHYRVKLEKDRWLKVKAGLNPKTRCIVTGQLKHRAGKQIPSEDVNKFNIQAAFVLRGLNPERQKQSKLSKTQLSFHELHLLSNWFQLHYHADGGSTWPALIKPPFWSNCCCVLTESHCVGKWRATTLLNHINPLSTSN